MAHMTVKETVSLLVLQPFGIYGPGRLISIISERWLMSVNIHSSEVHLWGNINSFSSNCERVVVSCSFWWGSRKHPCMWRKQNWEMVLQCCTLQVMPKCYSMLVSFSCQVLPLQHSTQEFTSSPMCLFIGKSIEVRGVWLMSDCSTQSHRNLWNCHKL